MMPVLRLVKVLSLSVALQLTPLRDLTVLRYSSGQELLLGLL